MVYSIIQRIRYVFITNKIHNVIQSLSIFLLRPAYCISLPITSSGTITTPFLINIAISEEFLYRYVLQGLFLTTVKFDNKQRHMVLNIIDSSVITYQDRKFNLGESGFFSAPAKRACQDKLN